MAPLLTRLGVGSLGGFGFSGGPSGPGFSASGGTVTTPGNGYTYHTFSTPSSFVVSSAPEGSNVEVLVVAGGGGGGQTIGGGGGAGGIVFHSSYSVATTSYTVTIGNGGTGAVGSPAYTTGNGSPGQDSVFGNLTAKGGGGGGNYSSSSYQPGGSGGGTGAGTDGTTSATQPSQTQTGAPPGFVQYGNVGGESPGTNQGGAGGGAGGAASGPTAGVGQQFPAFTGTLIGIPALEPLNGFYGGGGGAGGRNPGGVSSPGGSGGGGAGGNGAAGSNGTQYSGGGGGGGGYRDSPIVSYSGGNGAPGIVIIRYLA
jgi:hypothetical protein